METRAEKQGGARLISGGHFEYQQDRFNDIADELECLIRDNKMKDEFGFAYNFSKETLKEFKKAIQLLKKIGDYVNEIDLLVSGDTGEEDFRDNIKKINTKK